MLNKLKSFVSGDKNKDNNNEAIFEDLLEKAKFINENEVVSILEDLYKLDGKYIKLFNLYKNRLYKNNSNDELLKLISDENINKNLKKVLSKKYLPMKLFFGKKESQKFDEFIDFVANGLIKKIKSSIDYDDDFLLEVDDMNVSGRVEEILATTT